VFARNYEDESEFARLNRWLDVCSLAWIRVSFNIVNELSGAEHFILFNSIKWKSTGKLRLLHRTSSGEIIVKMRMPRFNLRHHAG
jgi:hypothetical protein